MAKLVKRLRPSPVAEPVICFDGLPGQYAQFDFGEVLVTYEDGTADRIVFFAGRLKYSRFMHVRVTKDQRAESVVRGLLDCLHAFGGCPKEWVFDNPRTIRVSPIGVKPIKLHRYLRDLVAEMRVIPTFCAPRSGNQKGSVERLVGFAKRSFFLARTFRDRATFGTARRLAARRQPCASVAVPTPRGASRPRPSSTRRAGSPSDPSSRPQTSGFFTSLPSSRRSAPSASPGLRTSRRRDFLGAPATILVRARTIEVTVGSGKDASVYARANHTGEVRRLPHHRQEVLAVVHGHRKIATFRRQCLLRAGSPRLGLPWRACPPLSRRSLGRAVSISSTSSRFMATTRSATRSRSASRAKCSMSTTCGVCSGRRRDEHPHRRHGRSAQAPQARHRCASPRRLRAARSRGGLVAS